MDLLRKLGIFVAAMIVAIIGAGLLIVAVVAGLVLCLLYPPAFKLTADEFPASDPEDSITVNGYHST
ncbi:MAG: hypothetical protein AAB871_04075 [Patescibacteria group bacterium]